MWVSDEQAALIRYCVAEMVRRRQLCGQPVPNRIHDLRLFLAAMTVDGTQNHSGATELVQGQGDLIDTEKAAEILGYSTRYIRRIASDLDGQRVSGRWAFNARTVTEYAEARNRRHDRQPTDGRG